MHDSGSLFERYNSDRKSNLTLLVFSALSLGALGYFELTHSRRVVQRRGYGRRYHKEEGSSVSDDLDTTSIYSAPAVVDRWREGKVRASTKSRSKPRFVPGELWMGLLRMFCLVLPIVYTCMFVLHLRRGGGELEFILLAAALAFLALFSLVTVIGLLTKRTWGIAFGYLLAIFNLVAFPFGTAAGLFLLMGLVGASPVLILSNQERFRGARERAAARAQPATG
jgi:hypothetical protein